MLTVKKNYHWVYSCNFLLWIIIGVCTDTYVIYQSVLEPESLILRFIGKLSWILINYTWLERGDSQL